MSVRPITHHASRQMPPRGSTYRPVPPPAHQQAQARSASDFWWLHPLAFLALIGLVYASFIEFDFLRVVPKAYIPSWNYAWGGVLLLALAVGIGAMTAGRRPPALRASAALDVPRWAMAVLLATTVFAYLVWFEPLLSDPKLLFGIVAGTRGNLRNSVSTTPGVTTMTQFGVAYVIAHAVLRGGGARRIEWWERAGLWLLVLLAAVRSVAWSERLAVIEMVLPYIVARLAFARVRSAPLWQLGSVLPMAAPVLLYGLFTGTEYFRSWEFYRDQYASIWQFSFERLVAYYATASNNGIGLLAETRHWPEYSGRFVAEWLYLMPGVGEGLRLSVGDVQTAYVSFLERFARPEFNNPTGLFPIVFDIGYAGSAAYFLLAGALVGRLYDGWRRQAPAGVLFYPVSVIFLIELLRFNYFASTRFFPTALALAFVWLVTRRTLPRAAPLPMSRPSW